MIDLGSQWDPTGTSGFEPCDWFHPPLRNPRPVVSCFLLNAARVCASPFLPCCQVALDDEQELHQARAQEASRLSDQRLKEAFIELKHSDKAKDMKEQVGGAIFIRVGTRLDQETSPRPRLLSLFICLILTP